MLLHGSNASIAFKAPLSQGLKGRLPVEPISSGYSKPLLVNDYGEIIISNILPLDPFICLKNLFLHMLPRSLGESESKTKT
jgi:hypothetical protein